MSARRQPYNRELLLAGNKRNAILELSEVRRYGTDSYGDPDYVSIYGMHPVDWYAKGVRVLGRTAVECTRMVRCNNALRHRRERTSNEEHRRINPLPACDAHGMDLAKT